MAEEQPAPSRLASQENAPLVVNLHIVSPSVGVGNLRFPDLPATTTVRQLKAKIRESLESRPADDNQRLIHRGRLLACETDTLQDVLGEDAIRTGEQQTIHLVVRDTGDHVAPLSFSAQATPAASRSPAPGNNPFRVDAYNPQTHTRFLRGVGPGAPPPVVVPNASVIRPGSAPIGIPQAAQHPSQQQQHQDILQRMNQLQQREAQFQEFFARHRAARDSASQGQGNPTDPVGGRNSPFRPPMQTVIHEGIGPDGQQYSFRITVNEVLARPAAAPRPPAPASEPVAHRPLSAADVQNILHGADATRATQTITNAMQRSASGAGPANVAADIANMSFNAPVQPIPPGVTTPVFPGLSRNASRTATPDSSVRPISRGNGALPGTAQSQYRPHAQSSQRRPDVYILSSPTGPRALLINSASEIYASPAARPPSWAPSYYRPPFPYAPSVPIHVAPPAQGQVAIHLSTHRQAPTEARQQTAPGAQQQPLPQALNNQPPVLRQRVAEAPPAQPAAPQVHHPGNPGAAALGAAIWPHIWLLIRLVAFAWWFSYSNPSWERWLTLLLAFLVVFAINTGLFTGMVNDAFHPVREQLEGMIPFADPDRQRGQRGQQQAHPQHNQQPGPGNRNGGDRDEPDPARVAARLVAQRRIANGNWLADQLRRVERAGILFLASFAPGVAERHIQQLEERERAERRAAEEARAAAQQAAQEAAHGSAGNQEGHEEQRTRTEPFTERDQVAEQQQPPPPVVEV
ncbi:hypothetical protein N656DRAFT_727946 [Canariomyces notabilis]|uniref:Ubiquitin-like domain-containing protein n=1 Tax=Canariomyces notabilis TaxID=2074819 RepID=A0AAN6YUT7_9PEZI|nr:hypothetical protein N656DRAFT_727946 [Canariomyces arenarius]